MRQWKRNNYRALWIEEVVTVKKSGKSDKVIKKKISTSDSKSLPLDSSDKKVTTLKSSFQKSPLLRSSDFHLESEKERDEKREKHGKYFFPLTVGVTAVLTALIVLGLTQQISPTLSDRTTLAAQTSGGVCLTESELKSIIKENNIQAYWTGPLKNATYTLNSSTAGQVFIRYVPDGEKCDDVRPNFRVIATYQEADAFATTESAGTTADGVSLLNADGSIVYFNKNVPTNIYLAYPGIDYQIEIYDPDPKEAVSIATTQGRIQIIKG
jgi:hypothetical protein